MKKNNIEFIHNKLIAEFPQYQDYYKLEVYNNTNDILISNKYGFCKTSTNTLITKKIPTIESSLNKNEYFINMFNHKFKTLFVFYVSSLL